MKRLIGLMMMFYFIQTYASNPGIASLPLALYLKESLGLSAIEVAQFQGIAFIPWTLKLLWGIIADSFPIFGYQIKSYFVICYLLTLVIFLKLSSLQSYTTTILLIGAVLASTCIAFSDVLADKLMVMEGKARGKTAVLQASQWAALGFGGAVMYYLSGWIAKNASLSFAFLVSAVVPLVGLIATLFLLQEKKGKQDSVSFNKTIKALWTATKSRQFLITMGFIIFLGFSPTPPLLFYERDILKFTEDFLGILGAFGFLGVGLGAVLFGILAPKAPRRILLNMIIGLSVISMLSLLFMYDEKSAIVVQIFNSFTNIIAILGIWEISAQACPDGAEGTTYALLVSVSNFTLALGAVVGAWLYDSGIGFSTLVIIGAVFTSFCLFLIPLFKLEQR